MYTTAAVLYGPRDLRVEQRQVPDRRSGDVLLEVTAVGICGSDVHHYRHAPDAGDRNTAPFVLGHEASGVVITGDENGRLSPGQRVAVEPHRPCGRCRECMAGRYNVCRNVSFLAHPPTDGALAGTISVPAVFCFPVAESISDEEAALVEPLAVGLWASTRTRIGAGDRVLIVGAGPIGLLTAQVARAVGATKVTVVDVTRSRVEKANTFAGIEGLLLGEHGYDGMGEFDVVIECSGAPGAIRESSYLLAPRGRIGAVGIGRSPLSELDMLLVQSRELELYGVYRYAGIYEKAIALLEARLVDVATLITHRFPLSEADLAMTIAERDPTAVKAMVDPRHQS